MGAKKRGRRHEKGRGKRGSATKKVITRKKVRAPKKTATKARRGGTPKPKATKVSPPMRARARREGAPASRPEAPPVEVIEVVRVDVMAVQEPSTMS